jgi:hypothetical protein
MLRAHGQPAVAHGRQDLANRTFMQNDAKASLDLIAQINPTPANDLVKRRIGASLDQRCELRPLFLGKLRQTPSAGPVTQPGQTLVIVPVHPVAQVCGSIPQIRAAFARSAPSRMSASAKIRRAGAPSFSAEAALPKAFRRQIQSRSRHRSGGSI